MSRRVLAVTFDRKEREVSAVHPAMIRFWFALAVVFGINTIANAVAQDWGDALDGLSLTLMASLLVHHMRNTNALMGGWR